MRNVRFIAARDLRYMLRQRETLLWTFLMPVLFFWFIGTVTSGMGSDPDSPDPLALVVPADAGFLADEIGRRLEDNGYRVDLKASQADAEGRSRIVTLPAALTDSVLAGVSSRVWFEQTREGIDGDYETVRVGRAVYTVLADVLVAGADSLEISPASFEELRARPRSLSLDVSSAGKRREPPSGFEQAVPGTMVMFTLLVMATSGAILLVVERREGLLRRLAATPIPVRSVVLGKWVGRLLLGLVQIGFAMATGAILFKVHWGPNLPAVCAVMLVYGGMMAGLGLLLGTLARTEKQAVAIGVIATNLLGALGGCWWPIEITPAWMQKLALFLPTGWAMNALHALVSFGDPVAVVVPHLVGMTVATFVLIGLTVRMFRYE
jgi:ABC-type Na+ efflux pump permease subunit